MIMMYKNGRKEFIVNFSNKSVSSNDPNIQKLVKSFIDNPYSLSKDVKKIDLFQATNQFAMTNGYYPVLRRN